MSDSRCVGATARLAVDVAREGTAVEGAAALDAGIARGICVGGTPRVGGAVAARAPGGAASAWGAGKARGAGGAPRAAGAVVRLPTILARGFWYSIAPVATMSLMVS